MIIRAKEFCFMTAIIWEKSKRSLSLPVPGTGTESLQDTFAFGRMVWVCWHFKQQKSKRKITVMLRSRDDLCLASRVVIKAGTSVVSTPDGYCSLSRMSGIVEHAAELVRAGKEVLIVTSGAVGVGKQRLRKQSMLRQSMSDILFQKNGASNPNNIPIANGKVSFSSACAAAGQVALMQLYETMFQQFDIPTSQILVTAFDFTSPERRRNIQYVLSQLLALGIVPLLNENDAVSANQGYQLFGNSFSDNDSLASMVSVEMSAQLLILLTDVAGVYDRPPNDPDATLIDIFSKSSDFKIGEKSMQGRGGMGAKVDAALNAISGGVQAVVIAAGGDTNVIGKIIRGEKAGTLFLHNNESILPSHPRKTDENSVALEINNTMLVNENLNAEEVAKNVRIGSRQLQALDSKARNKILEAISCELCNKEEEILFANSQDIELAQDKGLSGPLLSRLELTSEKIKTLAAGIRSIARLDDPIGEIANKIELAPDLILDKISCPIGVLLVIFESRPDCLPQITALAIKSGNGLLLKGGKEAENSNQLLFNIISNIILKESSGKITTNPIGMISRTSIPSLLKLDNLIDLVIPRGSNDLVRHIKERTKIPVLGHAAGICHMYVDEFVDQEKAENILLDAKTSYPSACNAVETLLLHESTLNNGVAEKLLRSLRAAGVVIYGGARSVKEGLTERVAESFECEYSDLSITVEIVASCAEAIEHINKYGSGHTECIISEDKNVAEVFLRSVDSACVFHNASTRFADGYRFGLGAEVGISTGKIHARGPVGIEGLMTTKYLLRSNIGHCANDFAGVNPKQYTHRKLKI